MSLFWSLAGERELAAVEATSGVGAFAFRRYASSVPSVRFLSWIVLAAVFVLIAAAGGLVLTEGGSPGIAISVVFLVAVAIPAVVVLLLSYLFGGIRRLRNRRSHRFANLPR